LAIQNTFESVLLWQNTFEIYLLGLFMQNTFVFCHTPNNCFTSVPYIPYCCANNIIESNLQKMISAHIGRPLCHWRRHVGAAVTAAMTASLSPPLPLPPLPLPLPLPQLPPSPPPPAPFLLLLLPLFG
jgi:hypothetical protein